MTRPSLLTLARLFGSRKRKTHIRVPSVEGSLGWDQRTREAMAETRRRRLYTYDDMYGKRDDRS